MKGCRLCRSENRRRMFEKEDVPYFRCLDCGFVFAEPATNPNLENRLDDYEAAYLDYLGETAEDEVQHRSCLAWMERSTAVRGKRLIDVGTGSGKWVRHLRRQGVEAQGLEPSRALFEHFLAGEEGFSCERLETFAAAHSEEFDVATALDVIEHVEQPLPFLEALARALRPGGMLFVSTPDVSSWLARLARKRWHYYNRYHLCLFDRRTLGSAAGRHGLFLERAARRGRKKSLHYLLRYCDDFVLGGRGLRAPGCLQRLAIPINLFDTMDLCFRKQG